MKTYAIIQDGTVLASFNRDDYAANWHDLYPSASHLVAVPSTYTGNLLGGQEPDGEETIGPPGPRQRTRPKYKTIPPAALDDLIAAGATVESTWPPSAEENAAEASVRVRELSMVLYDDQIRAGLGIQAVITAQQKTEINQALVALYGIMDSPPEGQIPTWPEIPASAKAVVARFKAKGAL